MKTGEAHSGTAPPFAMNSSLSLSRHFVRRISRGFDFQEVLDLEDHAPNAIVVGEHGDRAHLAETESGHGRLLIGRIADWAFLQSHFEVRG